jgi:hypothetical protein
VTLSPEQWGELGGMTTEAILLGALEFKLQNAQPDAA